MTVEILGQVSLYNSILLPFFSNKVSAGFPSPAQDHVEKTLDLNELCVKNPAAAFFVKVSGDSMRDAGIYDKDILIVDRSLTAKHGDFVVASINREFTIKELCLRPSIQLIPHNPTFETIVIKDTDEFELFGVVTNIVRNIIRT
ncbi:translesion error-prone DNA polymerase V autoproteolytic subunit [Alishewanella tabrizica]|uniref:Protein UmuD n=1 Tax=Alishewanella tabrizica TaxID=671278 RepID=A0ABQ2WM62_9ALTE|nr:translesion error-prone DNA polymerase V autoproteolytic subunit [Alishewanella tabrizica]GGW57698.1 protein UmuD [Alishewanella tabrizica]